MPLPLGLLVYSSVASIGFSVEWNALRALGDQKWSLNLTWRHSSIPLGRAELLLYLQSFNPPPSLFALSGFLLSYSSKFRSGLQCAWRQLQRPFSFLLISLQRLTDTDS